MKRIAVLATIIALLFSSGAWAGAKERWDETQGDAYLLRARGSSATYTLLTAGAVATDGSNGITILANGHGFYTGSQVTIHGSTNYDGTHTITGSEANSFTIAHKYTAETMDGTETLSISLKPQEDFQLLSFRLRNATAPSTAEKLSIVEDSGTASNYDGDVTSYDMSGTTRIFQTWTVDDWVRFSSGDEIDVVWDNTDGVVWAIEMWWKPRN